MIQPDPDHCRKYENVTDSAEQNTVWSQFIADSLVSEMTGYCGELNPLIRSDQYSGRT